MFADVFKVDPEYEDNEAKYKDLRREILGEGSSDESGSGGDSSSESDEEEEKEGGFA